MINSSLDDCGNVRLLGSTQKHSNGGFPDWFIVFNNCKELIVWYASDIFRIVSNLGIFPPDNIVASCHETQLTQRSP